MNKFGLNSNNTFEFHVAKKIRKQYNLDESFFSISGNVVFANFYQVRQFVLKINENKEPAYHLTVDEVNAVGLLDEIYHIAIRKFLKDLYPNSITSALDNLNLFLGGNKLDDLLLNFIEIFPPQKIFTNEIKPIEYLKSYTNSISNRELILEELILLYFANRNPAFYKMKELFDENYIDKKIVYNSALNQLRLFFKNDDLKIGLNNRDLFDFLSMPFLNHSDNVWDQLEYIKNEWGIFIDQKLLNKIKSSSDLSKESIVFEPHFDGGGGGNPTIVPSYKGTIADAEHHVIGKSKFRYAEDTFTEYEEPEQFTPDVGWMPNLVLIAKNIYVWLDQLSKKYKRDIRTLDQIPIEELEQLKKWNTNGLWLIGIWERSSASKKIKHLMGNIDAEASAYSLYDYKIANDLGGEEAYKIFNNNAKIAGIRLASDMVPNHTGIFSKWIVEHPDYFIHSDHSPFPNYSFTGENLSQNPNIEIRIEDQYWEMSDAAVVFERKDLLKGKTQYYYHGNDGTNMPWNDTAQLNLMKEEVREAIIQKIMDVARKFSVIRFDAAMTLAKKHYSRLWFPEPGKGGDIPSRSDYAMSKNEFDEFFPKEFWREVVDRINNEMPETLLLAEAFWLMEGYFVRTLGMHRVYNSAFMNMFMNEENEKYRQLITNTLEFEPEILKRYVNFMSNPDEETAIEQFGSDDKYFGVLILMITLPGLPMFAHGQIEGYTEKYGMEYKRAYYIEQPKQWLVEKHEREIFPILKKRYIFSEVQKFWFFDFINEDGNVNENIFAFTNEYEGRKGFVLYNNKFEAANGKLNFSRNKLTGNSSSTDQLHNTKLAKSLSVNNNKYHFYIFKDITNGLEYLYNGYDLNKDGLFVNLKGFEYRVFLKFEEIINPSSEILDFYKNNYGKGFNDLKLKFEKFKLVNVHRAFENVLNVDNINKILNNNIVNKKYFCKVIQNSNNDYNKLILSIIDHFPNLAIKKNLDKSFGKSLTTIIVFNAQIKSVLQKGKAKIDFSLLKKINSYDSIDLLSTNIFNLIVQLKDVFKKDKLLLKNYSSELLLYSSVNEILKKIGIPEEQIIEQILIIDVLQLIENDFRKIKIFNDDFLRLRSGKKLFEQFRTLNKKIVRKIIKKETISNYLLINTYKGIKYFNKERLDKLLDQIMYVSMLRINKKICNKEKLSYTDKNMIAKTSKKVYSINKFIREQAIKSNYKYDDFMKLLETDKI